ncbi:MULTISPECIES: CDP-alcohol phosphatidyltransferase family protein [Paractinoplanes]|uniref:CDP-alcohol phosphatidyltransferase family protein n=1 Tax=Paractinoplanes hotanensis TaxID=2906497 RepID=A0ABT0XWS6_9ACTN|nr:MULTISPECIES: CDP-alcohol phosphatidyltransferase family protein [Actinoplanes]MCM4077688.1 CDP-alcohol phosphatidyltransferase family protein [Actinoplanes hotanensis]
MTSVTAPTSDSSRAPVVGLAAQLGLLALLGSTLGLTATGLIAGAAYGLVLCGLLGAGLDRARMHQIGAANAVTLSRAILVGGVTAMVVTSFAHPVSTPALVAIAGVALALDGVDGQVARRTGTTTALGARFDMEVDAFLILVLSVYAGDRFGWWWVAIGAFRYAFVVAAWALPWLNAALPPRFSRKVVAALQGIVLALVTADLLPAALTTVVLTVALASLTWSFGRDSIWLYRASRIRAAARERWAAPHRRPALVH